MRVPTGFGIHHTEESRHWMRVQIGLSVRHTSLVGSLVLERALHQDGGGVVSWQLGEQGGIL